MEEEEEGMVLEKVAVAMLDVVTDGGIGVVVCCMWLVGWGGGGRVGQDRFSGKFV